MSVRKKLELQLNQPTRIKLLFDEPACCKNYPFIYSEYSLIYPR